MPNSHEWSDPSGPFRAEQIREGDPYELSNGHSIRCMTAGKRHANSHTAGSTVLMTDPGVIGDVGIDAGISFNNSKNLRAPDIVVGMKLREPGWATEAPPLAVEYADTGQNEDELASKIEELLTFGTKIIWVVRLVGPLRVEIHEPGRPVRIASADDVLRADGILQNPVPVRALVDPNVAIEAALHNILARKGYRDLDHVREEGFKEGEAKGEARGEAKGIAQSLAGLRVSLQTQLAARGWTLSPSLQARIAACDEQPTLVRWLIAAITATDVEAALR